MLSELATRLNLEGWKARCAELASPTIDLERYAELIAAFASQLHADASKPDSLSAAALAAPRHGSATDKHGLKRPARQIALALFALTQTTNNADDSNQPRPDGEDEKVAIWARIRYTQTLSSLSTRLRAAIKQEEVDRLAREHTTLLHTSKLTYAAYKDRPISRDVITPSAMPVTQTDLSELLPFFRFLDSNAQPFDGDDGVRQCMSDKFGAAYTGAERDQFQFGRGVVYADGRLDLCKQVVGPAHIEQLMQSLRPNGQVQHFLLGNNVIGRPGADAIAAFLRDRRNRPQLPAVRTWYLAGCDLDGESMGWLVDELQYEAAVEAIWLKRNPLSLKGAQQIARLLSSPSICSQLRVLDVDNTGLLDDGAAAVFEALKENHSVRHLYISGNGIGPAGAGSAARYFEHVRSNYPRVKGLRSLFMSVNRIGDEGAITLSAVLSHQPHLKRLLLASNRIESAGVVALASALENNDVLQVLDLGLYTSTGDLMELPNRMENEGAAALAHLLTVNSSLRYLSLAHNGLTSAAFPVVVDAVRQSSSLCYVEMVERGQPRPEVEWAAAQSVVRANAKRLYGVEAGEDYQSFALHSLRNISRCRDIDSVYRTRDFTKSRRRNLVKRWPETASSPYL